MIPIIGDIREKVPSSRTYAFSRIGIFDVAWAVCSPILAFLVRDGSIDRIDNVGLYSGIALIASVVAFQWFKISCPIPSFFSVHDALGIVKACLLAVASTTVFLFIFTRLQDAPRSVPVIHFFILVSGLFAQRTISRLAEIRNDGHIHVAPDLERENVLIIEASRLAWFFSKIMEEFRYNNTRIIAILDERPELLNRSFNGYPIVGSPAHIENITAEYETHGIEIHKVIIATKSKEQTNKWWPEVFSHCAAKKIRVEWLSEQFLFLRSPSVEGLRLQFSETPRILISPFWKFKRLLDVLLAAFALIAIAPLAVIVIALVLIDVGYPAVFWQQRVGYLGQPMHLYKFRTMRATFDRFGRSIPDSQRLSWIGWLLRATRLDEIPQLVNILMGSMSLIGPRPLLPDDQPKHASLRLQVRPGLSGLAQVNGGKLLSPEEKDALDEWYVKHASLLLDIQIVFRTISMILRGDRRNEDVISTAVAEKNKCGHHF